MKIFGPPGEADNQTFSYFIEQVLKNQLGKVVQVCTTEYRADLRMYIYQILLVHDNQTAPLTGSATLLAYLRSYLHQAYESKDYEKAAYTPISPPNYYIDSGQQLVGRYVIANTTIHLQSLPGRSSLLRTIYWAFRGWARAVIDVTTPPPVFHADQTMTLLCEDASQLNHIASTIYATLIDEGSESLIIKKLTSVAERFQFRAQAGFPLLIGDYGLRQDFDSDDSDPREIYREWLKPCELGEDVHIPWEEFGRLIIYNGDCLATDVASGQIAKYMEERRALAEFGLYPLGPFPGLLPWPEPSELRNYPTLEYLTTNYLRPPSLE